MFSSRDQLEQRTGEFGIGREKYLEELVTEFQDTDVGSAREQVLANLANFAYDPINWPYLRDLEVVQLFLDSLRNPDPPKLLNHAVGGLCNISCYPVARTQIINSPQLPDLLALLSSDIIEVVLCTITTLIYLCDSPEGANKILFPGVVEALKRYKESDNPQLRNLATLFLNDCVPSAINEPIAN